MAKPDIKTVPLSEKDRAMQYLELLTPRLLKDVSIDGFNLRKYFRTAIVRIEQERRDIVSMHAYQSYESPLVYKYVQIRYLEDLRHKNQRAKTGEDVLQLHFYNLPQPHMPNNGKMLFCSWEAKTGQPYGELYVHFVNSGVDFYVRNGEVIPGGEGFRDRGEVSVVPQVVSRGRIVEIAYKGWPTKEHEGVLRLPTTLENFGKHAQR